MFPVYDSGGLVNDSNERIHERAHRLVGRSKAQPQWGPRYQGRREDAKAPLRGGNPSTVGKCLEFQGAEE